MTKPFFDPDLEPAASPHPTAGGNEPPEVPDTPESSVSSGKPVSSSKPQKKPREILGYDLKTLFIAGSAILAALAYLFWPDPPASLHGALISEANQIHDPTILTPQDTHQYEIASSQEPVSVPPTIPAPEPEPVTITADAPSASAASELAVSELDARQSQSEKRIAELEARLKSLEQVQQATAPTSSPRKSATTNPPSQSTVRKMQATRTPGSAEPRTGNPSVKDWQINSVYPGMAWLTWQNSTYAVKPGDTVMGLTIRSIDAQKREISTSHGIIRGR